ncbi:hypothetical protein [Streptomyces sp. NRRL F-5126]|uniref:hypothetical protein n=1 Tax=Streptomyces sp. NRRL F-5126 TaxID=1463857 RepID=UPI0004C9F51B|nr:hypothetical protein [Streptomyces sp. NRRL F-5126]
MANDVTKYCLANAQPASEGRPAAPATMAQCGSKNPHHQEQAALVKGLHTAFMPPHPTQPTTVALSGVEKHGTTAEVTGDHVVVDGSKLSDIVSSHSKNTTSGRSKLTLEMVRIKSAWYMGDSHLGF